MTTSQLDEDEMPASHEAAVATAARRLVRALDKEARGAAQGPFPEPPTKKHLSQTKDEVLASALLEVIDLPEQSPSPAIQLSDLPGLMLDRLGLSHVCGPELEQRVLQRDQRVSHPLRHIRMTRIERPARVMAMHSIRRVLRCLGLIRQISHDSSSVGAAGTGMPAASEHDTGPRRTGSEPTEEAHGTSREATA